MNITSSSIENFTSLLIVNISDVDYCLSNTTISSIVKPDNIQKLKTKENSKYSLLQIENKSIPLIDLKKIFYNKVQDINSSTRVIVVEYMDTQFGLMVEKIKEMIALGSDDLKTKANFILANNSLFIEGIVEFEDKELLFLNIERIIKEIGYF